MAAARRVGGGGAGERRKRVWGNFSRDLGFTSESGVRIFFFFFNQGGGYDFPEAVVHCTALLGLDRIGLPEMGLLGPNSV